MLKTDTMPSKIKSSHYWTFRCVDKRAKSFISRDGSKLTDAWVRSHILPNMRPSEKGNVQLHCRLPTPDDVHDAVVDDDADPEDAAPHVPVDKSSDMAIETADYMGWRCSYKKWSPSIWSPRRPSPC